MLIGQNVRNKLINADFSIWQRGTSFTLNAIAYTADRWHWNSSSDGGTLATGSISRIAYPGADGAQPYALRINNTTTGTSLGPLSYSIFSQRIEDVRVFAGKTVTVSLWIASTIPNKVINVIWYQSFGIGGSTDMQGGSQITLTGGSTLTRYDVTLSIPGITGKVLGTNNLLVIGFFAQQGSTHAAGYGLSSVNWQSTGNIDVYRMQVNEGGPADFELAGGGTIAAELALCQRYYEKSYNINTAPGTADYVGSQRCYMATTTTTDASVRFSVTKRTTPAFTVYSPATGATNVLRNNSGNGDAAAVLYPGSIGIMGIPWIDTAIVVTVGSDMRFHWTADAEL